MIQRLSDKNKIIPKLDVMNANQPKVQHQPYISSAGLTQGHQPVHRCALAWQGVDHRTAPAGKKKSDGRELLQLAKRPHDKSEPSNNRDLRPTTSSGPSAHVALHHNRTGTGRADHCRPIKARTRAACRARGLSQLPLHVNTFGPVQSQGRHHHVSASGKGEVRIVL